MMMKSAIVFLVTITFPLGVLSAADSGSERIFDVTENRFGAVAAEKRDNAKAIQSAINAAAEAGGGRVILPSAKEPYLSGPLKLRSHVHLVIENGALLQMLPYGEYPGTEDFINATEAEDVSISGGGKIDGQGRPWWEAYDATPRGDKLRKTMRPKRMIVFDSCTKSEICDVTLTNPPNVHIAIHGKSSHIIIAGICIDSPEKSHNTDGIDMCGRNIVIKDCAISCGDDNIAIGGGSATEDVRVSGCKFGFGHGMSIGSHTVGGVKNLVVEKCVFDGTHTGIRLKSERDRGGVVENLIYRDLVMNNVANAIHISSYYGEKEPKHFDSEKKEAVTDTTPYWKNIIVQNITAKNVKVAGILWGLPEAPIENLTLDHISIEAEKGMQAVHIKEFKTDTVKITVGGKEKAITRHDTE